MAIYECITSYFYAYLGKILAATVIMLCIIHNCLRIYRLSRYQPAKNYRNYYDIIVIIKKKLFETGETNNQQRHLY